MGCGSAVSQVSDSHRESAFRPIRLLEIDNEREGGWAQGKIFIFGQSKTQRKIIECQPNGNTIKPVSTRTRIPMPKINYDPFQQMYEESQQIFHLGSYGFSTQPPFNKMLVLYIQTNLIFLCGGRDYDGYNVKCQSFFYCVNDDHIKRAESQLSQPGGDFSERKQFKNKFTANKFQRMAIMNRKRFGHMGIFSLRLKCVLVFGGYNERGEIQNNCERYNILQNCWKDLPQMNVARAEGNCFQFGNKVYLFGGKASAVKLSKKIQVFDLDAGVWEIINVKFHRGIKNALSFSIHPNQIMIAGGKTYQGSTKSTIKIDLINKTYLWDSNLNYDYNSIKNLQTNQNMIIFGGHVDTCQRYINHQWVTGVFQHRKLIDVTDLDNFSYSAQSVIVKSMPIDNPKYHFNKTDIIIFGNDQYPCLMVFDHKTGQLKKQAISMSIRLKSNMGICQYSKNKYVLAGGCDLKQKKYSRSVYLYDLQKNQGVQTYKMFNKRYGFAICSHQQYIYVFGGFNLTEICSLKKCQRFNLQTESWESLPELRRARSECYVQILNNTKIAVFGGFNGVEPVLGIQIFDTNAKTFQIFQPKRQFPIKILGSYYKPEQYKLCIFREDQKRYHTVLQVNMSSYFQQKKIKHLPKSNVETIEIKIDEPLANNTSRTALQIQEQNRVTQLQNNKKQEQQQKQKPQNQQVKQEEYVIMAIKPRHVEISGKVIQLEQSNSINAVEQDNDNFQIEQIHFSQHQAFQNIQNGKLVQPLNRKESQIIQIQHKQIIQPQIMKINSSIITRNQKQLQISVDYNQSFKTKQVQWLSHQQKYYTLKTTDHIYFFTEQKCIIFDPIQQTTRSCKLSNLTNLPLNRIMI